MPCGATPSRRSGRSWPVAVDPVSGGGSCAVHVLAISGSLRSGSSNTILLRAAAELAPRGLSVAFYEGLGELPHFNPDLDDEANPPPQVREFRDALRAADGVMICSPEYAHGVPGSLKNALDWVVGSGELSGKPVALINASPRATTLRSRSARSSPRWTRGSSPRRPSPSPSRVGSSTWAASWRIRAVLRIVVRARGDGVGDRVRSRRRAGAVGRAGPRLDNAAGADRLPEGSSQGRR